MIKERLPLGAKVNMVLASEEHPMTTTEVHSNSLLMVYSKSQVQKCLQFMRTKGAVTQEKCKWVLTQRAREMGQELLKIVLAASTATASTLSKSNDSSNSSDKEE